MKGFLTSTSPTASKPSSRHDHASAYPSTFGASKSSPDTMYLFISFRKSTPPQNRQLNVSSAIVDN